MKNWGLLLLPLLLTGCGLLPASREMEDMALVRTMGVDAAGEELCLTAAHGEESEQTLSPTLAGACLDLKGQGEEFLFFGCADQVLVGEELVRKGLSPVLKGLSGDGELSLGADLWMLEGKAADGVNTFPEKRLETLRRDSALGTAPLTRTAGEIYADLLDWGTAWVPALSLEKDSLTQSGYGVLERDRLAGVLKGEEARGLELLLSRPRREQLEGQNCRGWLIRADTDCRFRPGGRLLVRCHAVVRRGEGDPLPADRRFQKKVEQRLTRRIAGTLTALRGWGTDCAGLGRRAGCLSPALWRSVSPDWPERFRSLPPDIRVRVTLRPH